MPYKLSGLEVAEVSLVDRAANRRKFLLYKRDEENTMKDLVLKVRDGWAALLEHIAKADETLEKALAKFSLSEKARMAAQAALAALETAKEELPQDIMRVLAEIGGYPTPVQQAAPEINKSGDGYNYGEFMKMTKNASGEDVPDYEALPKEVRPMVKALWEGMQLSTKSAKEKLDSMQKAFEEQQTVLQKERDEREAKDAVAKAAAFGALPVTAEELGPVLRKMSKALTAEELQLVDKVLKAGNEAIKNGTLVERGGGGSDISSLSSIEKRIDVAAKDIVKRDGCTYEQAYMKALDEDPELAKAEREERDRSVRTASAA